MDRPQILVTAPMLPIVLETLGTRFALHKLFEQEDSAAFLKSVGPRIRGLATSTLFGRIEAALIDRLPNLEIIASFGVGYDNVDAAAAAARTVVVTNTPGVLDEEVADLTIGLLLATIRRIPQADRFLREGRWAGGDFPLSPTLRNRRIGILGLGKIGKAIARRLEGFGVYIAYHGRHSQSGVGYDYFASPAALAKAVDTLIVIVPGGAATRHLVDEPVLQALGRDGILINVARGTVVDEQALIRALGAGTILMAGLDVYEDEPRVPQELIDTPNAVLLPHIASASVETRNAMGKLVADNLIAWFEQGRPLTPVAESLAAGLCPPHKRLD
jgi:lactate dehydrogenase-like 2-hydroxyacid dehydrogenase